MLELKVLYINGSLWILMDILMDIFMDIKRSATVFYVLLCSGCVAFLAIRSWASKGGEKPITPLPSARRTGWYAIQFVFTRQKNKRRAHTEHKSHPNGMY
jgi:hypothetical protein